MNLMFKKVYYSSVAKISNTLDLFLISVSLTSYQIWKLPDLPQRELAQDQCIRFSLMKGLMILLAKRSLLIWEEGIQALQSVWFCLLSCRFTLLLCILLLLGVWASRMHLYLSPYSPRPISFLVLNFNFVCSFSNFFRW